MQGLHQEEKEKLIILLISIINLIKFFIIYNLLKGKDAKYNRNS